MSVIDVLLEVCEHVQAEEIERLALFQAAIVASNLDPDFAEGDRIGVLGQNPFWGPAAARRDPRTAADVFLREARRVRAAGGADSAARLAVRVQGGGSVWRHRAAGKAARRILAGAAAATAVEAVA